MNTRERIKVPLDVQLRNAIFQEKDKERILTGFAQAHADPLVRSAIAVVAYDFGLKELATRYQPLIEEPEETVQSKLKTSAKQVCKSEGEVELVALLSTIPLTNGGRYHERKGRILRINFSDGKVAYCKSRNAQQEALGIELAKIIGLPSYHYELLEKWIVLEGVPGRILADHRNLPQEDTTLLKASDSTAIRDIIAIVAFDYIFGMMDRNERGIIIRSDTKPVPIDHEYLLVYKDLVNTIQLLRFMLFLQKIGLTVEHIQNAEFRDADFQEAANVYQNAAAKMEEIRAQIAYHSTTCPFVDITIGQMEINYNRLMYNISTALAYGIEGFIAKLHSEIAYLKRRGMEFKEYV